MLRLVLLLAVLINSSVGWSQSPPDSDAARNGIAWSALGTGMDHAVAALTATAATDPYACGDADGNSIVNISDAVYLITYIFAGGSAPNPLRAGDADGNSVVNISDAVYLIAYIFAGGSDPICLYPILAEIGPKSVDEGAILNFTTAATNPDGTIPVLTAENLPANATYVDNSNGTGTFNFVPDFTQAGVINVTFMASDGFFGDSEVVAITVNNVNRAPVLAAIGPKSVNEAANLNFNISASDPDATIPLLTVLNVPPNATFADSGNGRGNFSFDPNCTQAGVYDVTFIASDGSLADSEVVAITVIDACGTVTDIDGNVYQTIKIGDQWWMKENLKVTHYRNGDPVPNVTDDAAWSWLFTGAYCNHNNDPANVATYGRLYNWYTVADSRNLAPAGWHVPSDAEWQTLVDYLGGSSVAGGKMKEAGTAHWQGPSSGGTNESGFTALPGGYRDVNGLFNGIGNDATFWSSTEVTGLAWTRFLSFADSQVHRHGYPKRRGVSVRCVRD